MVKTDVSNPAGRVWWVHEEGEQFGNLRRPAVEACVSTAIVFTITQSMVPCGHPVGLGISVPCAIPSARSTTMSVVIGILC